MKTDAALLYVLLTKNNLFVSVTDLSGAHTLYRNTGGQVAKNPRDKNSPFTINTMIRELSLFLLEAKIQALEMRVCMRSVVQGGEPVFNPHTMNIRRGLERIGITIYNEQNITPVPTDRVRAKYGRRGRRS